MTRTLSSRATFAYKYIFPPIWISCFGLGVLAVHFYPEGQVVDHVRGGRMPGLDLIMVGAWVAGSGFILWIAAPLKRVKALRGELLVSNFVREWRVPYQLATHVTQNRWINVRPITILLRADLGFGTRIVFIPPTRLRWRVFAEDPEVDELRQLLGLATAQ